MCPSSIPSIPVSHNCVISCSCVMKYDTKTVRKLPCNLLKILYRWDLLNFLRFEKSVKNDFPSERIKPLCHLSCHTRKAFQRSNSENNSPKTYL